MIYLILIAVFLVSVFLYVLIELKKSIHMLYIIPLAIMFTGGTYFYLDSLFGYPVYKSDEEKFSLLSFWIDEENDRIYLWTVLENEIVPKAIIVPYSQEEHNKLVRAQQQMAEGIQMIGEFDPLDGGRSDTYEEGEQSASSQGLDGSPKSRGGAFSLIELTAERALPKKSYQ
jgi:hypothetical protein